MFGESKQEEEEEPLAAEVDAGNGGGILLAGGDDEEEEDYDDSPEFPSSATAADVTMSDSLSESTNNVPQQPQQQQPPPSAEHQTEDDSLFSTIVQPSPFSHHNTSDRYRSALTRVQSNPTGDAEAWQALVTEAETCFRQLLTARLNRASTENNGNASNSQFHLTRIGSLGSRTQQMTTFADSHGSSALTDPDEDLKYDWIESIYGSLLSYFPYSANYHVKVAEILFSQTAGPGEDGAGSSSNDSCHPTLQHQKYQNQPRRIMLERKLDGIFRRTLGVEMDGSVANLPNPDTAVPSQNIDENNTDDKQSISIAAQLGGMCSSSVDLWLLYVRKRSRDASRQAVLNTTVANTEATNLVRQWTVGAYETALSRGAGFAHNNQNFWGKYLSYVKSWVVDDKIDPAVTTLDADDRLLKQTQMQTLRSIYQRLIAIPMTGLDGLWKEYEAWEQSQSEALAGALSAEQMPRYQHAQSVYQERNRVFNVHELRANRLAVPPADDGDDVVGTGGDGSVAVGTGSANAGSTSATDAASGGAMGIDGATPGTSDGATASGPSGADENDGDAKRTEVRLKMSEEASVLSKWRRRSAYERTNPERLSPSDLASRVRATYREVCCAFMRHPEVWHEWSQWELLAATSSNSITAGNGANATISWSSGIRNVQNARRAAAVLALARSHIPDSSLLTHAHASAAELCNSPNATESGKESLNIGAESMHILTDFCDRSACTLGFVLLQRLVRRYRGVVEARRIFSKARKVLRTKKEDCGGIMGIECNSSGTSNGILGTGTTSDDTKDTKDEDGDDAIAL